MSSRYVRFTIPTGLAARLDQLRGQEPIERFILERLHELAYGKPIEDELRREIADLHATMRALGQGQRQEPNRLFDAAPTASEPSKLGW
jgi:hypothetical protein